MMTINRLSYEEASVLLDGARRPLIVRRQKF